MNTRTSILVFMLFLLLGTIFFSLGSNNFQLSPLFIIASLTCFITIVMFFFQKRESKAILTILFLYFSTLTFIVAHGITNAIAYFIAFILLIVSILSGIYLSFRRV
ncbi:hypothetical protein [Sutcliffiella sp. NC1]|uniref:hypothetical protein n=1 Tax=Sutcliffiella sp. NC1 TaxID=3004096 RepID=UPI0022DD6C98|nr:hypothetical protein [Sutcliffiella sp. NC1]WBL14762.1 hypothetical protein O1A01_23280 [Sutcliffiella sp. NC1]